MTKPITPRLHGILDYVVVAAFALAPSLFGLTGFAATLSYLLAVVHLAMTVLTAFPLGLVKVVPFRLHGLVEVVVGVALVVLAFALFGDSARVFYLVAGLAILAVWALTDYGAPATA